MQRTYDERERPIVAWYVCYWWSSEPQHYAFPTSQDLATETPAIRALSLKSHLL